MPGPTGTVTSVSAAGLSPLFNANVTTATTTPSITFTQLNASANTVFGNFTGSANAPGFGKLSLASLAANTANTLIGFDAAGNPVDVTAGANISIVSGVISSTGGGGGGVTSVAATTPSVLFNVSGSPITSSGTLAFTLTTQSAYTAFGNFTNATATPSFSKIPYQAIGASTANELLGWDASGNATTISSGTGISINAGVISATGAGSQNWQSVLTTGSTLTGTNAVTNTGQTFTWVNGGTGLFKFSGVSHDTTNTFGVFAMMNDSSIRSLPWQSFATKNSRLTSLR